LRAIVELLRAARPLLASTENAGELGHGGGLDEAVDDFERRTIARALQSERWNISDASVRLRVSRQDLQRRMKRLEIQRPPAETEEEQ